MIYMLIFLRENDIFESFYNIVCNSADIYQIIIIISIFTDELYRQINSIGKAVDKNYTSSYFCGFFYSFFFSTAIPSIYTDMMFSSVFTDGYSDEKFH
jgi:hypothetical protein